MMQVSFYGHVRQYRNIQGEIDANIKRVIESSEYVPDPNPSGMVGAGGTQVVTLKVTETGSSDLLGFYVRPWETPSPDPQPDFQMAVVGK